MQKSTTKRLVTTAIMVALAAILSLLKVFEMPLGGSITLLSMLPIVLLSVKYGVKWGMFSSLFYAVVQIAMDLAKTMTYGYSAKLWIGSIVFDYIIAFGVLGLAGAFAKKGTVGICFGTAMALALRFCSHVVSGTIFFNIYCPEEWGTHTFLYAICYNGAYMLPELIFTLIGVTLLVKVPQMKKLVMAE
ncbi:MAG: energy-coupled thiamine transporter ThiT [Oscillospiraceae bacterium]